MVDIEFKLLPDESDPSGDTWLLCTCVGSLVVNMIPVQREQRDQLQDLLAEVSGS
jgi:hypothetical protein